jgi:putative polymerase
MTAQAAADVRGAFAARLIVLATLTFNMALAFANTQGLPIREAHVVAAELALVGCTFLLVWNRSEVFYVVAAAMGSWLVFAMVVRGEFDPKVLRDAFIPFLFYLLGRHRGSPESADRLVTAAIVIVSAVALFEWLFLDLFLSLVDVRGRRRAGAVHQRPALRGPHADALPRRAPGVVGVPRAGLARQFRPDRLCLGAAARPAPAARAHH